MHRKDSSNTERGETSLGAIKRMFSDRSMSRPSRNYPRYDLEGGICRYL